MSKLINEKNEITNEYNLTVKELNLLKNEKRNVKEESNNNQMEIQRLERQVFNFNQENFSLTQRIKNYADLNTKFSERMGELEINNRNQINSLIARVKELKEKFNIAESLKTELKNKELRIGRLLQENKTLVEINSKLERNGSDSIRRENERLNKEIEIFINDIKTKEQLLDQKEEYIKQLELDIGKLKDSLRNNKTTELNKLNNTFNEEIGILKEKLDQYNKSENDYKDYILALKEKTDRQEQIINTQNNLLKEMKQGLGNNDKLIEENRLLKTNQLSNEEKLIGMKNLIERYDLNFAELNMKLKQTVSKNKDLEERNRVLTENYNDKVRDEEKVQESKTNMINDDLGIYKKMVNELRSENDNILTQNLKTKAELKQLKVS